MPYNFVADSFHTAITAEALRAKIDRKSAILHQRGHQRGHFFAKISGTRGRPPPIIFAHLVRPMNALQLCRRQFSHKETCSRLSSSKVRFTYTENGHFAFFLKATYDDHLRLIEKRVVDFLLVLIELF